MFRTSEELRAGRLLEFPELLEDVARFVAIGRSAESVRRLTPTSDRASLDQLWAWVEELRELIEAERDLRLAPMLDLESAIGPERLTTGLIESSELAGIGAAAFTMAEVLEAAEEHAAHAPITVGHLANAHNPRALAEHLQAALETDGRIKDGASPRLGSLRRSLTSLLARVRDIARREMGRAVGKDWTTAGELTLRGDHYCIPVKSGRKGSVPGIVHDRSDSGQTIYIEPMAVVESSNDLQEARIAVREEEQRIVAALNQRVGSQSKALLDLYHRLVKLDTVRARVRWGRENQALSPRWATGELRLEGFRHPILASSLRNLDRGDDIVPLNLTLRASDRVLLISGPNAGGKTVALKAVGIAALMAQTGIPLPAADHPHLPVFDAVLVDLGDEQSIADALSSFSAHVTHLQRILDQVSDRSLVLLDEVGSGTDPHEGVALARATLEYLGARGARTLATTHYGQLKALVHDTDGFRNASMAFDDETYRPRFSLRLDVPGSSHALEIAERLKLPASVLERARSLVGQESLRLDAVLAAMEKAQRAAEEHAADLEDRALRARVAQKKYEEMARDLKANRREHLERAEREAEGIVRNARARVERLLGRIREAGGGDEAKEIAREVREQIDTRAENLAQRRHDRTTPAPAQRPVLEPGVQVRHVGLGQVARVVEVRGKRVTLEMGGRRVVADQDQLARPDGSEPILPPPAREGSVRAHVSVEPALSNRVDVRGQDAQDAWRAVDKAIDGCVLAGVSELEVIHGKGTGVLRDTLRRRLDRDSRVREATLGGNNRFDDGVTLVRI